MTINIGSCKLAARYKPLNNFCATLIIMSVCFFSCQPEKFDSAEELKGFIDEPANNLTQTSSLNGYQIKVAYRPADLLIYQEIGGEPTDHQRLFHLERKYEDNYYFVISLEKSNAPSMSSDEKEKQRLHDLSGSIIRFLSLTTSEEDTIEADGFTIEQNNVLNNNTEILFVLSKQKSKDKKWIQFNVSEFGLGLGNRVFKFHISDLEEVPKLKFELIS
jgi:hypothetical protein